MQVLLDYGTDPNLPFKDGNSALLWAVREWVAGGDLKFITWLLDHGADVNLAHVGTGVTALMIAALAKHTDLVKLLLERGADVSQVNHAGQSVLDMLGVGSWSV